MAALDSAASCLNLTIIQEIFGRRLANLTNALLKQISGGSGSSSPPGEGNLTLHRPGQGAARNLSAAAERLKRSQEDQAIVYIIVVLMFYSISIVVIMIKYMRAEQREMRESKQYSDYLDYREGKKAASSPLMDRPKSATALASVVAAAGVVGFGSSAAASSGGDTSGESRVRFSLSDLLHPSYGRSSGACGDGGGYSRPPRAGSTSVAEVEVQEEEGDGSDTDPDKSHTSGSPRYVRFESSHTTSPTTAEAQQITHV